MCLLTPIYKYKECTWICILNSLSTEEKSFTAAGESNHVGVATHRSNTKCRSRDLMQADTVLFLMPVNASCLKLSKNACAVLSFVWVFSVVLCTFANCICTLIGTGLEFESSQFSDIRCSCTMQV